VQTTLLIDALVRQTTVLIAHLSTAAGIRAPLAYVADEVFLRLASEIEAQGVGRKVVADIFGLALRSYQKKVQRLTESSTERERTLWEALLELIQREGSVSRGDLQLRFGRDGEMAVASVLKDLVGNGLVTVTGRGMAARYAPTSERERERLLTDADHDSLVNLAWLAIYRGAATEAEVADSLRKSPPQARPIIEELIASGRVERRAHDHALIASTLTIPVGSEQGWEAAVLDHFRAVANALANKVRQGRARSDFSDVIGGGTLSFDLEPGHPFEQRVTGLLEHVRKDVNALFAEVSTFNRDHTFNDERRFRVWFYFGQNVERPEDADARVQEGS
jgi:Mn-dependent DtxR family transcriptional regulator